jgi:hypothetical protein
MPLPPKVKERDHFFFLATALTSLGESSGDTGKDPEDNNEENRDNDGPEERLAIIAATRASAAILIRFAALAILLVKPLGVPSDKYDEND